MLKVKRKTHKPGKPPDWLKLLHKPLSHQQQEKSDIKGPHVESSSNPAQVKLAFSLLDYSHTAHMTNVGGIVIFK